MIGIVSGLELIMMAEMAQARPFGDLTWQKRLLVLFPQGDDKRVGDQRRMLVPAENEARDLLVVEIPPNGIVQVAPNFRIDAATVRKAYGVTDDSPFTVLLIGKDGGVKLRSQEPVSAKQLSDTIDAMPMRRREVQGG